MLCVQLHFEHFEIKDAFLNLPAAMSLGAVTLLDVVEYEATQVLSGVIRGVFELPQTETHILTSIFML